MAQTASLKETPFTDFHLGAGAKMVPFAGYTMPIQYAGITTEHLAVRNNVGLFDLSHMGEFEVSGPGALAFLQRVTTNAVNTLSVGQIHYSCMTYPDGGIVDDLLVYRLADRYFLVVNASNIDKDFAWLDSHKPDDVTLTNRSDEFGLLAIQGPNAEQVMSQLTSHPLADMPYYTSAVASVAGVPILFSRTGYTGEDGFELYIPVAACDILWQAVTAAGKKNGMSLIGLGARDSLRLEMRMALYGNDIDQTTSPVEAGLSWIVDFEKEFIGAEILRRQKETKPSRRLVCLEMEGKGIPRQGYEIQLSGSPVGRVTSGIFSPSLQRPIAMGYLPTASAKIGQQVAIMIRSSAFPATVVKPPFYKEGSHR